MRASFNFNFFLVPDATVREAASFTLAALTKLLGEPVMTKLMPDLEAIKLAKIKECVEKTVVTGKRPKLQPEGSAAPAAKAGGAKVVKPGQPKKPVAGAAKAKPVARPPPPAQSSEEEDNYEAEFAAAAPPKPAAARPAAAARAGSAPARKTSAPAAAASARPRPGELSSMS
jgi:cytoskeleton-associated protein 5